MVAGGRGALTNISCLAHKSRRIHLRSGCNDLRFTDPLLRSGGRERLLQLSRKDDILDEDTLDGHSPFLRYALDDLFDFQRDGFAVGHDALESPTADYVTQSGLGTLDERLTHVADAVAGAVGVGDVPVLERTGIGVDRSQSVSWRRRPRHCLGTPARTLTITLSISVLTLSLVITCWRGIAESWICEKEAGCEEEAKKRVSG